MNEVVRVYGTCDDWQVEFSSVGNNMWQCSVPADITDGQYACRFYAVDGDGDIGMWCGVLYMSSGKVRVELDNDPVEISLVRETMTFEVDTCEWLTFSVVPDSITFKIIEEPYVFNVVKENCCCG